MMAGEDIGEPSSTLRYIIRALEETISVDVTEDKALLNECKQAAGRGEDRPADEILYRVLLCAICKGNGSLMNEALRLGRAPWGHEMNSYGNRLLGVAASCGKEDIVSSLLEAGVVKDGLH